MILETAQLLGLFLDYDFGLGLVDYKSRRKCTISEPKGLICFNTGMQPFLSGLGFSFNTSRLLLD